MNLIPILLLIAAFAFAAYRYLPKPALIMSLRESLKLHSQQLNAFVAMTIAYVIATNGADLPKLIAMLPEPYNLIVAPVAGYLSFMLVSYLRLRPQPKVNQGASNAAPR